MRTRSLLDQERQPRVTGQQFDTLGGTCSPGEFDEPHIAFEGDIAKWIESASYSLAHAFDPELDAAVDEAVELLAGAQQPDGYLNSYFTVRRPGERFADLRDAHELYCAGQLIEAAVVHYQATGKTALLKVMARYADLIDRGFHQGGTYEGGYDAHQQIELALVRLAHVTGQHRYTDLALRMIRARLSEPLHLGAEKANDVVARHTGDTSPLLPRQPWSRGEHDRSHIPDDLQSDAYGHPVRAMYLHCAIVDLAVDARDDELAAACDRLWESLAQRRLHITGGIATRHDIDTSTSDYRAPDTYDHSETCAAIGLIMWAQRMVNTRHDGAYVDVLERALYNGVLAGASSDEGACFNTDPLTSDGAVPRHECIGVGCCSQNLARLLSSLELYAYSRGEAEAVLNLYVSGTARFDLLTGSLVVLVNSQQPTNGSVVVEIVANTSGEVTLCLRIPAWARRVHLSVAGHDVDLEEVTEGGYVRLLRNWQLGDLIELDLEMEAERVWAHPTVEAAKHKVALQRGPIVFCAVGVDHDVPVSALSLPRGSNLEVEENGEGAIVLLADAMTVLEGGHHPAPLYSETPPTEVTARLRAVPYFSHADRGPSDTTIWIHEHRS